MSSQVIHQIIEEYFVSTTKAIGTLIKEDLIGHSLVIIYSTIDTCGLLDAPPDQSSATGKSFQSWVKKYVLANQDLEFNEFDLWGARCGVLHSFSSQSDLSNAGKARELHYYTGKKSAPHNQSFVQFTMAHEDGKHLPVNFMELANSVFTGMKSFVPDLVESCQSSPAHVARLYRVLQTHSHGAAP